MPQQTVAAGFAEKRLASATTGNALLTTVATTAAYVQYIPGSNWVSLTPRNFSTAVTVRWGHSPYLTILKNQDALATEPTDLSFLLQDGSTTVTAIMNSFDTLANGDALYIGCHVPFGGLFVDVANTNSSANDMTAVYFNGGLASLSITDNTDTGASLAQDGTITWTTPADWRSASFQQAFGGPLFDQHKHYFQDQRYWIRLVFSAAVDSSTSLNAVQALPMSTAYDELASGQTWEQSISWGYGGLAGLQALTDAGTANLLVSNGTYGRFLPVATVAIT